MHTVESSLKKEGQIVDQHLIYFGFLNNLQNTIDFF